jgi:hypothetical protein
MINWHRLFGLTLADYFTGTRYTVEMEKDVARKRQVLDIVIISGKGDALAEPCDGLEDLRAHNLMTYKSGHESLDAWAMEELVGHYVNYRKAFAREEPVEDFGLYAVTTRRPQGLMRHTPLVEVKPGVYRLQLLQRTITVIVPREVEPVPRNALWELFSFEAERVVQGARDYRWRQDEHASVLNEIYHRYREQGVTMSYTFEDFRHDLARELLQELPPEERLKGLPPEQRLKGLPPEELRKRLPPEERLKGLPPEEILKGLGDEEIARLKALIERRGPTKKA